MYGSNPLHVWERQNNFLILNGFFSSKQNKIFKKKQQGALPLEPRVVVLWLTNRPTSTNNQSLLPNELKT